MVERERVSMDTVRPSNSRRLRAGFTLMEMLIIIAIIAVLSAAAIPVLGGQVDNARIAVDQANVRSGKALALAEYMATGMDGEKKYYYNAPAGIVQESGVGIEGYGVSSVNDTTGEITGAKGTPNDGEAKYVVFIVTPDGQVEAIWGDGYGSTWRNLVPGLPVSSETDWHNYGKNKEAYDAVAAIPDSKRVASDLDALKSIANYFEGMSESDLRAALGKYYNKFVSGSGETLFRYRIDNTSFSVHFDNVRGGTGYFQDLGFTTTDLHGNELTDKGNQYTSEYLFTSDGIITRLGQPNDIKLKLNVVDGKVASARAWVNGNAALDSAN